MFENNNRPNNNGRNEELNINRPERRIPNADPKSVNKVSNAAPRQNIQKTASGNNINQKMQGGNISSRRPANNSVNRVSNNNLTNQSRSNQEIGRQYSQQRNNVQNVQRTPIINREDISANGRKINNSKSQQISSSSNNVRNPSLQRGVQPESNASAQQRNVQTGMNSSAAQRNVQMGINSSVVQRNIQGSVNNSVNRNNYIHEHNIDNSANNSVKRPIESSKSSMSEEDELIHTNKSKNKNKKSYQDIKNQDISKSKIQEKNDDNKLLIKPKSKNAKAGADVMISITKAIVYMVIITIISVFLSVIAIRWGNDIFAFVKSDDQITITIPKDATVDDVAEILSDNGIINYKSIFKFYCSLKHESGDFIEGEYTVSPSMSYDKLRYEFKEKAVTGTCWITIPEGYSIDDIIDLMVENGIGSREKYIDVINNYDFDYWFIDELEEKGNNPDRKYRLEGYLFPDTYEFYKSSSEEMVINKLLKRFKEVYVEDFKIRATQLGYSTDDIVTIASYIQKEAKHAADYMYVSSVIHNRLNSAYFSHLELDATIIYAIRLDTGEKLTTVTHDDVSYNSPYNSYLCDGLTPGAITNPGASAIRYALYPTESGYYYYVSDNAGNIYYASNEAEHNSNIAMVKELNDRDS